jgi:hypothetical protein
MSDAIYVLTDTVNEKLNRYIVDVHSGDINKLRDTYIDTFPDLIIRCFIKTNTARKIYEQFNDVNYFKILMNSNDDPTEWIVMPWADIFNCLCILICHNKTKITESTYMLELNELETKKVNLSVTMEELEKIFHDRQIQSRIYYQSNSV